MCARPPAGGQPRRRSDARCSDGVNHTHTTRRAGFEAGKTKRGASPSTGLSLLAAYLLELSASCNLGGLVLFPAKPLLEALTTRTRGCAWRGERLADVCAALLVEQRVWSLLACVSASHCHCHCHLNSSATWKTRILELAHPDWLRYSRARDLRCGVPE